METKNCRSCGHRISRVEMKGTTCPSCGRDVRDEPIPPPVQGGFVQPSVPVPPLLVKDSPAKQTHARPVNRFWRVSPRLTFYLTIFGVHVGIFILLWGIGLACSWVAVQFDPENPHPLLFLFGGCGCCGGLASWPWLLFGFWGSRWLAGRLMTVLLKFIVCPCCGFEFDAVDRWDVGGYQDHQERHVYNARSRINGARVGHINCPMCDATIMLR